jgi:hypothetical protein
MKRPALVLYAGIPPGSAGTGRLVAWFQERGTSVLHSSQYEESPRVMLQQGRIFKAVRSVAVVHLRRFWFRLRFWLDKHRNEQDAVLLHPQTLGARRTIDFVRRRNRPPVLFLLDSSYFCIRSYNHIPDENRPCLRCLGGRFEAIAEQKCSAFPVQDLYAKSFVKELRGLVREGRLSLVAQCATQAKLAERHFGVQHIPVVGLWTADWECLMAPLSAQTPQTDAKWDIVFHGFWVAAKGASWVLEVARNSPKLRFLFPFAQPASLSDAPANCAFVPMTWDTGLAEAARSASVVLVPSLWSAPVEGALLKSIAVSRAVAVVENSTAYAAELPHDLVLTLPVEPGEAGRRLEAAVRDGWCPEEEVKADWISTFRRMNEPLVDNLQSAVERLGAGENFPEPNRTRNTTPYAGKL